MMPGLTLDYTTLNAFLRDLDYPLEGDDLIDLALASDVDAGLVDALKALPAETYASEEQVLNALRDQGYQLT